jgi:hypothetical protein
MFPQINVVRQESVLDRLEAAVRFRTQQEKQVASSSRRKKSFMSGTSHSDPAVGPISEAKFLAVL